MSAIAIRVSGVGKRYRLEPRQPYRTLTESLARSAAGVMRTSTSIFRRRVTGPREDGSFWALRNVSFAVDEGEIVGVIGANGAGKSTLLKILSRITFPTAGRAEVHGRLGSLLEVGTGFHPELTGRENIILNGAILGMRRTEIQRKFDAIVDFAEVQRFIDIPVKHYSSGMHLRLAFAVAAHLEPEILLIDEVLAVGDAAFQKKCLGRMGEVAREGRTVLFVSHNMTAVQSLCGRAVWLRGGRVERVDDAPSVISAYLRTLSAHEDERMWPDIASAPGNEWIRIHRGRIRPTDPASEELSIRTPFAIEIEYWNLHDNQRLALSINLYSKQGVLVFSAGPPHEQVFGGRPMPAALFRDSCQVPGDLLNDGTHRAELYSHERERRDLSRRRFPFIYARRQRRPSGLLVWQMARGRASQPAMAHAHDPAAPRERS